MSGSRQIYWLCSHASAAVMEKINILRQFNIEAMLIPDLMSLSRAYSQSRLNTIIISDDLADKNLFENLQKIFIRPDYAGVRLILSLSRSTHELVTFAVALGFRDILPLDLLPEEWIKRYVFAAAGQATDLAEPLPQLTLRSIAAIHVPARISWISENELWLETRLVPPVGSQLNISGNLSTQLGVHHVSVKVLEHHQTHLHYRYSDALLCRWDLPRQLQDKKQPVLNFIQGQTDAPPYRIYNIIRTQGLRKEMTKQLDPRHFHLFMALNKTNMIHEPKYISPDAIVIEDLMCSGANRSAFKEMLDQLVTDIPIFVIGPSASSDNFQDVSRAISIRTLAALPPSFGSYLADKIGPPRKLREGAAYIPKNNSLSFAQVILPARLTSIHPHAAQLALHFPLGRYGICAVESPLFTQAIGRKVHIKVLSSKAKSDSNLDSFPYHISGLLIDLQKGERRTLASQLVAYYHEKLLGEGPPVAAKAGQTKPPAAATEDPIPKPGDIAIDPSAEELFPPSPLERAVEGISRFNELFTREWKIALITILVFGLFYLLIFRFSSPEEGNMFTDQLRIFKELQKSPSRGENNRP